MQGKYGFSGELCHHGSIQTLDCCMDVFNRQISPERIVAEEVVLRHTSEITESGESSLQSHVRFRRGH